MSKLKATPGPWKVGISCKDADPTGPGSVVVVPGDHPIGKYNGEYVYAIANCGPEGDAQTLADARLIAAAPDLYAALEQLLPHAERMSSSDFIEYGKTDWMAVAIKEARAVLAKARGEN